MDLKTSCTVSCFFMSSKLLFTLVQALLAILVMDFLHQTRDAGVLDLTELDTPCIVCFLITIATIAF